MDNHTTNATSTTSDNDNLTSEATTEDKIIGLQSCFLMYCQLLSSMESVKIYGLNRQALIEGGLLELDFELQLCERCNGESVY